MRGRSSRRSYMPDAVEAMVALGRLDEAVPLVEALELHGAALDRPWMLAVGARGRSMLQAGGGDLAAAEETLRQALVQHDRLPMPFERARTQLFLGQVLRRQRKKNLAAATLREAFGTFQELGMPLWANRVGAELQRTDAPRANHSDLTPVGTAGSEVGGLGKTNKDIATALSSAPRPSSTTSAASTGNSPSGTRSELAGRAGELGDD